MLAKPRLLPLLMLSAWGSMVLAHGGPPPLGLTLWTMVGGALAAAAGFILNQYLERDLDALMDRTASRPLAGRSEGSLLVPLVAVVLLGLAVALLWLRVNALTALLALAASAFYVGVYTLLLKRRTVHNTLIGGLAGALPILIGWTAVGASLLSAALLVVIAVLILWQPPHFWALALLHRKDYLAAGLPMLPVVRSERNTKRQCVAYVVATAAVALLLPVTTPLHWAYLLVASVLGACFVGAAVALLRSSDERAARWLFRISVLYLGLLFVALVLGVLL